jgi:hypothetical protein
VGVSAASSTIVGDNSPVRRWLGDWIFIAAVLILRDGEVKEKRAAGVARSGEFMFSLIAPEPFESDIMVI